MCNQKPRTQASAKIIFTRYGVHIRLSVLPVCIASRKDMLSTHCHHECAHVNHSDMRCDTRSSSSVTVVHGCAGTVMMGLTRSCMRPSIRRRRGVRTGDESSGHIELPEVAAMT